MNEKFLISSKFIEMIKSINTLILQKETKSDSNKYNLKAMKEHVEEIENLFLNQDNHWVAETVDLLILCFLLLDKENFLGKINEIIELRCNKFKKKILNKIENS